MKPMRPATSIPRLDTYTGPLPKGWYWQVKLNDERAWMERDGTIWNRFGRPFAPKKVAPFQEALARVRALFPGVRVDLALLGYRGVFEPGAVVVLDLPDMHAAYRIRALAVASAMPGLDHWTRLSPVRPSPGEAYYLWTYCEPDVLFRRTRDVPGLEGVIGRDPEAFYQEGQSRAMVKSKWTA